MRIIDLQKKRKFVSNEQKKVVVIKSHCKEVKPRCIMEADRKKTTMIPKRFESNLSIKRKKHTSIL